MIRGVFINITKTRGRFWRQVCKHDPNMFRGVSCDNEGLGESEEEDLRRCNQGQLS